MGWTRGGGRGAAAKKKRTLMDRTAWSRARMCSWQLRHASHLHEPFSHMMPAAKHWQYSFRHRLLRQLHPIGASGRTSWSSPDEPSDDALAEAAAPLPAAPEPHAPGLAALPPRLELAPPPFLACLLGLWFRPPRDRDRAREGGGPSAMMASCSAASRAARDGASRRPPRRVAGLDAGGGRSLAAKESVAAGRALDEASAPSLSICMGLSSLSGGASRATNPKRMSAASERAGVVNGLPNGMLFCAVRNTDGSRFGAGPFSAVSMDRGERGIGGGGGAVAAWVLATPTPIDAVVYRARRTARQARDGAVRRCLNGLAGRGARPARIIKRSAVVRRSSLRCEQPLTQLGPDTAHPDLSFAPPSGRD